MFKSLVGVLICSWAWRMWQERGARLIFEDEDVGDAAEKAGSLAPEPVLTWDFPYMGPSSHSHNSVRRRQEMS